MCSPPGIAGGDVEKARATAARIGALDACEGFLAQARIAELRKQNGSVEGLLQQAVTASPGNFRAREALAAYELGDAHTNLDLAAEQGHEAAARVPGRILGYAILAEVYAARSEWSELDAVLQTAEQRVPDYLTPYYRAAARLIANGRDPVRAERCLREYASQEPEGNQPTLADAQAKLAALKRATISR